MYDAFERHISRAQLDALVEKGSVDIIPFSFIQGRTFKNAVIIADEMQNSSKAQMKMLLTRIGKGSKMIILGDVKQTKRSDNGLVHFISVIKKSHPQPHSMK